MKSKNSFIFRFFFVYFLIQSVPLSFSYFGNLFSINWTSLHYGDIFRLAHYTPRFFNGPDTFLNWLAVAFIAVAVALVWTAYERDKTTNYDKLYYWIRVVVRYRLALAIFAYGFLKFYPLLAPYPSISNLNTSYGDFTRWKIFSLSLGIVPSYQSFLGLVEIICGFLLLYRKTASVGAFIIAIFAGNVFMSNIAYEGGEVVYSLYLVTLALFVLAYDAERISNLILFQKPAEPNSFKPFFSSKWTRAGRIVLKSTFIFFFVLLYGFKSKSGYESDRYQFPVSGGIPGMSGLYTVSSFVRNADTLVYDPNDSYSWKDVVFEEWPTISIRSNRPVIIDSTNLEHFESDDLNRTYELEGSSGRHYYNYVWDSTRQQITLRNKNKNYADEILVFQLKKGTEGTIVLSGKDFNQDSISVVLNRKNKKYLLEEAKKTGRRNSIKL